MSTVLFGPVLLIAEFQIMPKKIPEKDEVLQIKDFNFVLCSCDCMEQPIG